MKTSAFFSRGRRREPDALSVPPSTDRPASPDSRSPDPTHTAHTSPAATPTDSTPTDTTSAPAVPREIWVLVAAAFLVAIGFGLVAPVLPAYAQSFDVGVSAAATIISAFAFMRLVFAPAGGQLIVRFGERSIYVIGLLIVALSTGACAFATSYWQLLAYRGLGGIGSTMFTVSAMGLLVRLSPPTMRGRVSSLYAAGFLVGNILGPVLGGLMAGFGYRVPFLVYAGTLTLAAAVVAGLLSGASLAAPPGEKALVAMGLREALGDSAYRALLVAGFCNGWSSFGVRIALLPLFAAAVPGLGHAGAGVALTVFAIGNAVTLGYAGRAVDLRGRKPYILIGLAVNGIATAVLGLSDSAVIVLAVSLIGGLGAGVLGPAMQASVADVVGNRRSGGRVIAAFSMAQDAGTIVGPILSGAIADAVGFGWAFGLTGVLALVAFLAWLPARETLTVAARPPEAIDVPASPEG